MRYPLPLLSAVLVLAACSSDVSDLDDLETLEDACDPNGRFERGTDLDLQFRSVTPHVNQNMFFAVTVGEERSIEALMVLSVLDDPNLHLVVPKLLPGGPSELAFWADGNPPGFDPIENDGGPTDHQWTRPVCPDGKVTFTHATPFQDIQDAISGGAIFDLQIPALLRRPALFDRFHMWVRATLVSDEDADQELQTRVYYRWSPLVAPTPGADVPEQREPPTHFQIGGNALGEPRGAIDQLSFYDIEFVIDVDASGDLTADDFVCSYPRQQAPDEATWSFELDLTRCDAPAGFDPLTFEL